MPGDPPPGIVVGTAIKTDGDNDNDTQEAKIEKKALNITQYGIKRKYKLDRKFKCKLCGEKLSSVQEFNQHYLAQTVHTCSFHLKPLQSTGTCMQITCTSAPTVVMASPLRANWNPTIKCILK